MKNSNNKIKILGKLGAILGAGTLLVVPIVTIRANTSANQISITNPQNNTNNTEQLITDEISMNSTDSTFEENDLIYTKTADDQGYSVAANPNAIISGELIIPNTCGRSPVIAITDNGFKNQKHITSIVIHNEIKTMGSNAFEGCIQLSSVTFTGTETQPSTLKSISQNAFNNCVSLKTIIIPNRVDSIESNAFAFCSSLTNVIIGSGVTSIGTMAFFGCFSLKNISIPEKVTSIGNMAFNSCPLNLININLNNLTYKKATNVGLDATVIVSGGTELNSDCGNIVGSLVCGNLILPNTVTSIAPYVFDGCLGLKGITIGINVSIIGNERSSSFNNTPLSSISVAEGNTKYGLAKNITSGSIVVDKSITGTDQLADDCHNKVPGLACGSLVFPDSVTSVKDNSFVGCEGITGVKFSNNLKTIGVQAFGLTGITSVTIPDSVTSIGKSAFGQCPLTSIKIGNKNPAYKKATNVIGPATVIVSGNDGELNHDCSNIAGGLACGDLTIPNTVTSIAENAFFSFGGLTSLTIGPNVTTIGVSAIATCNKLTTVMIPDSVTFIDNLNFRNCENLKSVYLPSNPPKLYENPKFAKEGQPEYFLNCSPFLKLCAPTNESAAIYKANEQWKQFADMISVGLPPVIETNNNLAIIIGCSVGGIILIGGIVAGTIIYLKKYKKPHKNKK